MKTFAFMPGQVNRAYAGIVSKYKRYDNIVELAKVGFLAFFLVCCILLYLYFVNMSSTRGYFLKQANQEMVAINFQHEIDHLDGVLFMDKVQPEKKNVAKKK